jgi:hypothetical protein
MVEAHTIESILVADCGTVATKLLLLEKVADSYRFIAQAEALTTHGPPWRDISIGVSHAIEELESITGRRLYGNARVIAPRQGLAGVDAFVVLLSAAEPLHLVLAGLVKEMSLESAARAANGTYTDVQAVLSREGSLRSPQETWSRTIRDLAPDGVVLVGGVDGGAKRPVLELAEAVALASSMLKEDQRPIVIFAGNRDLRPFVTKLMGDITDVRVVDNVHPVAGTEYLGPLQEALETLYAEQRMTRTPGVETLSGWSRMPFVPASAAFSKVVDFLWHREGHTDRGVLGADIGAGTVTIAAEFDEWPYLSIYDHGIAKGLRSWLESHDVEDLRRWIPEEMDADTVQAHIYAKEQNPGTVPQTTEEVWVEMAVVREMLRSALERARPAWDVKDAQMADGLMPRLDPILISGGGVVHTPRPGQALLAVLDGLQPVGISTVLLDVNRAAPALGAVAGIKPLAAASALESGTLVSLGTVISPVGRAGDGDAVLQMSITYENGGELDVEARYGEIEIWPLLPDKRATIEIKPTRRFDVGMGNGRGVKVEVVGGLLGIVVDARGRPLRLPEDPDVRRRAVNRWIWDVGG